MIVTSLPSRFTSATPSGTRCSPSGTSPFDPYSVSPSKKITGSSSRMADLSRPFASAGVEGATTFSPGTCAYQHSSDCECWAASWWAAPPGPRTTIGILNCPPDM